MVLRHCFVSLVSMVVIASTTIQSVWAACSGGAANGVVEAGEECDDGNSTNADGCTSACVHETCGDGILNGTRTGTERTSSGQRYWYSIASSSDGKNSLRLKMADTSSHPTIQEQRGRSEHPLASAGGLL